jgi:hypothetical protein
MKITDAERKVASLILGELSPDETNTLQGEVEKDPECRELFHQMQGSIEALWAWHESFKEYPASRKEKLRPRNGAQTRGRYRERMALRRRRTIIAAVAAAAVFVVLTLTIVIFSGSPPSREDVERPGVAERPEAPPAPQPSVPEHPAPQPPAPEPEPEPVPEPPAPEVLLAEELDWLRDTKVALAPEPGEGVLRLAKTEPGVGTPPGAPGVGAPPGAPGVGAAQGGPQEKIERFTGYFEFKLRLPGKILDGYELRSGKAVSKEKLWLLYEKGDERLTIFLCKSAGEDTDFTRLEVAGRSLVATRKSGFLIGFEGLPKEAEVETLTEQFLPNKSKEEENE